jgi:hypothetical protein
MMMTTRTTKKQKTTATATATATANYANKSSLSAAAAAAAAAASTEERRVDNVTTLEGIMLEMKNTQKILEITRKELIKRDNRIISFINKQVTTSVTTAKEIITKQFQDEVKSLKQQILLLKEKENDDDNIDEAEAKAEVEEEDGSSAGTVINLEDESADDSRYKEWKIKYEVLKKYVNKNDGKIPPKRYKEEGGFKLGLWVRTQRQIYKFNKSYPGKACRIGKMTNRRKDELEKIKSWFWVVQERRDAGCCYLVSHTDDVL